MKKTNVALFLVVACIFTVVGIYTGLKKFELKAVQSNAVAELFSTSLPDSSGQIQPLSQWKGKTLLVNFWATWCAPCIDEMPELSALQLEMKNKNIQIIGIGIDNAAKIADFSSRYKVSFPLYVADTRGVELGKKFGNQSGGLPFTVLIDANGQVEKTYLGRLKLDKLKRDLKLR